MTRKYPPHAGTRISNADALARYLKKVSIGSTDYLASVEDVQQAALLAETMLKDSGLSDSQKHNALMTFHAPGQKEEEGRFIGCALTLKRGVSPNEWFAAGCQRIEGGADLTRKLDYDLTASRVRYIAAKLGDTSHLKASYVPRPEIVAPAVIEAKAQVATPEPKVAVASGEFDPKAMADALLSYGAALKAAGMVGRYSTTVSKITAEPLWSAILLMREEGIKWAKIADFLSDNGLAVTSQNLSNIVSRCTPKAA